MNGKAEFGRNIIPRLQNMPEDEFQNTNIYQNSESSPSNKGNNMGFTRTNPQLTESINFYLKSPDNEHEPERFADQFKQRKKKIRLDFEQNKLKLSEKSPQTHDGKSKRRGPRKNPFKS